MTNVKFSNIVSSCFIALFYFNFVIAECSPTFVHLEKYGKCYYVLPGLWNWTDARKKCNNINSHPVVIDDSEEVEALKYFISLPTGYY